MPTINSLPETGFVRLPQVLALIPVSMSTWYAGIAKGKYPAPLKLGHRTAVYRVEDIRALIDSMGQQQEPSASCSAA